MTSAELSELLRRAFRIYKKYFLKIILLSILIYVPISVIQLMLPAVDMSGVTSENVSSYSGKLVTLLLSAVVLSLISGIFDLCMMYFTERDMIQQTVPLSEAFDFSLRCFPKYLATRILSYFLVFVLSMLCFIPGIIALFLFSLSPYIVVFRKSWGRKALRESSVLVRRNALAVILVIGLQYFIAYAMSFAVNAAMVLLSDSGLPDLAQKGIWTAATVLLYALISVLTVFMGLLVLKMIQNAPELNKDPEPAP